MKIQLRHVSIEDQKLIFDWRNNPKTRQFSIDPAELDWKNHCTWIQTVIENPNQQLLIAEKTKTPIGVLRFDLNSSMAEISIFLDPQKIHQGLGTSLIQMGCDWLKTHHPKITCVTAQILANNIASEKAFIKCGFKEKIKIFEISL